MNALDEWIKDTLSFYEDTVGKVVKVSQNNSHWPNFAPRRALFTKKHHSQHNDWVLNHENSSELRHFILTSRRYKSHFSLILRDPDRAQSLYADCRETGEYTGAQKIT